MSLREESGAKSKRGVLLGEFGLVGRVGGLSCPPAESIVAVYTLQHAARVASRSRERASSPVRLDQLATMASTQRLRQAWHQAAQAWPRDPLRPTVQFADAIRAAADRALADTVTLSPKQEQKAEQACQSLLRMANNEAARRVSPHASSSLSLHPLRFFISSRASTRETAWAGADWASLAPQYPMQPSTTKPASFPKHYARIEDAVARVTRGEKMERPGFLQRWFRFSA